MININNNIFVIFKISIFEEKPKVKHFLYFNSPKMREMS